MTEPPVRKRGKTVESFASYESHRHWDGAAAQLLPEELQCRITSFLDAPSLLRFSETNKYYHGLCRSNEAGWESLCQQLWHSKIHVCREAVRHLQAAPHRFAALEAYQMALHDAQHRQYITIEEFCFFPETGEGTVWSFRFKESAGVEWTATDPWYQGLPCRQMVFLPNGTVRQFIPAREDDSPGKEAQLRTASDHPTSREIPVHYCRCLHCGGYQQCLHHYHHHRKKTARRGGEIIDPPVTMTWRFVTRPMDLPRRRPGSYVRLTVAGRDVPTYAIRRSPNQNWGFVMESCWGLYASFPLPPRQRRLLRRTPTGETAWIREDPEDEINNHNSSSGSSSNNNNITATSDTATSTTSTTNIATDSTSTTTRSSAFASPTRHAERLDPLQDDSELLITNAIQWREAFLYNVGTRELPEGDSAMDEFDRAWGGGGDI